jgi:hypothetical protein
LWLIEVCERLLRGQTLYRDVLETNPPMSVLLYLAPVAAAKLLGTAPESAVLAWTLGFAGLSSWFCAILLKRSGLLAGTRLLTAAFGLFVLMALMPKQVLTQREHFAGMAVMPFLILLLVRHDGRELPSRSLLLLAGFGAGLCICIKPHFLLAVALPVFLLAASRRSARSVATAENAAAATTVLVYLAVCAAAFPDYARIMLPLLLETYVAGKTAFLPYLVSPLTLVFLVLPALVLAALPRPGQDLKPWLLMAAALGFFIAYLLQGKGWIYHLYPAVLVCGEAALLAALFNPASRTRRMRLALPMIGAFLLLFFSGAPARYEKLEAALRPLPDGAPVLIVTSDLGVNFPAVRHEKLRWISRVCSQWLATAALMRLAEPALPDALRNSMQAAIAQEQRWLLEDIETGQPEMIIFDVRPQMNWQHFAFEDAKVKAALAGYGFEGIIEDADGFRFSLFRRRPG